VSIEPWVTLQDVARHLQIAEDTVHRWIAKRGMPATKAGRIWRFKLSEVDSWLRSSEPSDETGNGESP
jgi:excisionase family DNA binding protein